MAGFENKYFFCLTKIKNKETRFKQYGARGLRFLTISLVCFHPRHRIATVGSRLNSVWLERKSRFS
jgi:hypothetical protein